jgi:hypothetical protein
MVSVGDSVDLYEEATVETAQIFAAAPASGGAL